MQGGAGATPLPLLHLRPIPLLLRDERWGLFSCPFPCFYFLVSIFRVGLPLVPFPISIFNPSPRCQFTALPRLWFLFCCSAAYHFLYLFGVPRALHRDL